MYKLIDQTKERDGVSLPHNVRQIDCQPAAPMHILFEHSLFKETLADGMNDRILTQFEKDTKNVEERQRPHRILKYVNSVL